MRKRTGNHTFSSVPQALIQRSTFNRSSQYKTSMNAGFLVPVFCDEVLPGDTFNMKTTMFGRLATPLVPIMDNIYLDIQYFFVPSRLLWNNFQKFHGERENPDDHIDYVIPTINSGATGFAIGSLADYFGIPTNVPNLEVNALPFRAYNYIYNEWYRDENLIDSVKVERGDKDDVKNYVYKFNGQDEMLLRRGKRHDYFTSCLPWAQKGESVGLPLSAVGDVVSNGKAVQMKATDGNSYSLVRSDIPQTWTTTPPGSHDPVVHNGFTGRLTLSNDTDHRDGKWQTQNIYFGKETGLKVSLDQASFVSINTMREAFQIQRLLERDARGGTRYTEIVRSHFGVISPDSRLQRPEYLGGASSRINVKQVENNASIENGKPLGSLAAFGVLADTAGRFNKSFTEHGYIIGLASIRADLTYQQGLNRMWSRSTRYDFYYPALAHLGEQEVLNKEIYAQGGNKTEGTGDDKIAIDNKVFGYQERYAEYRYKPNQITGVLRSNAKASLDVWHLSQYFKDLPKLSKEFISEQPPIERIVAVQNEPHFILDCYFKLITARPMPVYGVPGYIDHF